MNLAVIERDRILALLNPEQTNFIERKRNLYTRKLWIRLLCQIKGIKEPKLSDQQAFLEILNEFIYIKTLMGDPGTTPYKCQKCGRNLRYQYHLKHSKSGIVMKLGIECFKHVMELDDQVSLDIHREITKGNRLFMDYLIAYREKDIERYLPILELEDAPIEYKEQVELGLPLTKVQEIDFERWYRDYVYEQEMAEYEAYKKEIFNNKQLSYIRSLSKRAEDRLMRQRIHDYAYVAYEDIKDLKVGEDAIRRAKLGLPLSNRQLSRYNREKTQNEELE